MYVSKSKIAQIAVRKRYVCIVEKRGTKAEKSCRGRKINMRKTIHIARTGSTIFCTRMSQCCLCTQSIFSSGKSLMSGSSSSLLGVSVCLGFSEGASKIILSIYHFALKRFMATPNPSSSAVAKAFAPRLTSSLAFPRSAPAKVLRT